MSASQRSDDSDTPAASSVGLPLALRVAYGESTSDATTALVSLRIVFIDEQAKERAEQNVVEVGLCALHRLAEVREQRRQLPRWHPGLDQ